MLHGPSAFCIGLNKSSGLVYSKWMRKKSLTMLYNAAFQEQKPTCVRAVDIILTQ